MWIKNTLPLTMRIFNEFGRFSVTEEVIPIPIPIPNDIEWLKPILYKRFSNFDDFPSDNSTPRWKHMIQWWMASAKNIK